MFRPLVRSHRRPHRRGTSFVLIVVVMISFAAAVGVAFALFAGQTLRIAAANKAAQGAGAVPALQAPEPTNTVNQFFAALLYGTDDNVDSYANLTNALRGNDMAASMYGRNPGSTVAWNGVGTFREDIATYNVTTPSGPLGGNRASAVNYTQMQFGTTPVLLDPSRRGMRAFVSGARQPIDPPGSGREYIGKNAGYSYPDIKDFFLGQIDAATGQVLVPSFHREWLFRDPSRPLTESALAPTNPNWTNNNGRLLTLRPRPAEHPNFPRVPQNADGSSTGDVQNLSGGYTFDPRTGQYSARNDSLWMHIGLPPVQFGNRQVQPLVAPLIVPLDGLFNASAHGNNFNAGAHRSYAGHGPWEVNISGALPNDWAGVVGARGTPQQRNGNNQRSYDPNRTGPLSNEAPVAWDATAVSQPIYPTNVDLRGVPNFGLLPPPPLPVPFQSTNATVMNHPALFNPADWPATGGPRTYLLSDVKRMHLRYAFTPDFYKLSDLASNALNDLQGNTQFAFATGINTLNSWRTNPAHANHMLFTPRSFGLDRPKLVPNFASNTPLVMNTQPGRTHKPGIVNQGATGPVPAPYSGPTGLGAYSDFTSSTQWTNALAALGAVDLNRPLADYRGTAPTGPLSPTTMTNQPQADQDRQALARDIFVRLAAATGAALTINKDGNGLPLPSNGDGTRPQYAVPAGLTAGNPQYDALRYLAQLSANIVDYIDNDDVSTVFAWNNPPGANPAPTTIEFVFGVEKPRLVINEAYAELVNHPREMAMGPLDPATMMPKMPEQPMTVPGAPHGHVRFWLELVNPTNDPYPAGQTGPLAAPLNGTGAPVNGAAPLWYAGATTISPYRIEIARANRTTILPPPNPAAPTNPPSVAGATWPPQPNTPDYFTGGFAAVADIQYQFNAPTITGVAPNNGRYTPNTANLPADGFLLIGPSVNNADAARTDEFKPDPANPMWAAGNAILTTPPVDTQVSLQNSMAYAMPLPATPADASGAEYRRHVVLLRRLANPYMAFNGDSTNAAYNPYVTVDVMDNVTAFDAMYRSKADRDRRAARPTPATGYDPVTDRFSIGKVQPYAGLSVLTNPPSPAQGTYNQYQPFPNSMVQAQVTQDATSGNRKVTFGRHNGATATTPTATTVTGATLQTGETIMAPFDWLVHMDRPLVNQIELFPVRDSAPYLVTDQFLRGGGGALDYEFGSARWRFTNDGLARALEFLTVKPFTASVAHGGRVPGQINVNVVQDRRVVRGLLDPQAGNLFPATFPDTAWTTWMNSRSTLQPRTLFNGTSVPQEMPVPNSRVNTDTATQATMPYVPAPSTTDDETNGMDRPFLMFGAPSASPQAGGFAPAYSGPNGGNENLTILRHDGNPLPYLYSAQTAPGATYFQPEPVRKMLNNITSVNHNYAVFLTIGYFELDPSGNVDLGGGLTMPRLAQEAYINIPGDMRQKFFAVVDMSNMAIDPTTNAQAAQPFFTTLEQTARPLLNGGNVTLFVTTDVNGQVMADGVPVAIGGTLILGYGVEAQAVSVVSVTPGAAGQPAQVVVSGLVRTAWAGSSVSNVRPGYPGPQPGFRYTDAPYKGTVLPFIERVK